ncbi:ORF6N domain-containing protein [Candidatus Omnitrophota bacterium]
MDKVLSVERIKDKIYQIRGKKVMLDNDIAELYGVDTKQLTRQVRRNIKRFPNDFMFRVTKEESLRCQIGTSKKAGRGGRRYLPYAFTEQGIAMLSGVLNSERAIKVNVQIMRAFVALRRWAITHEGLRRKIDAMEKKYDGQFQIVFKAIRKLMEPPPEKPKRRIGFHHD